MKSKAKTIAYVVSGFIAVGLGATIGVLLYKHRIVETKCFNVEATIDAHDYRAPYTTYTTYHNKSGLHHVPNYHPARYYLYYTINFEGSVYKGNHEEVGVEYFSLHKDGEKVNAVYEKQWRADGSETYRIYLDR